MTTREHLLHRLIPAAAALALLALSGCGDGFRFRPAFSGYSGDYADVYDPVPRVNFGWRYGEGSGHGGAGSRG